MGAGASKKSKSMQPVRSSVPVELPANPIAPPSFGPYPGFDFPADSHRVEATYIPMPTAPLPVTKAPQRVEEEDAPSILLDDSAPVARYSENTGLETGTGLFLLESARLNGTWAYIPDDCEIEMEDVMSRCVEKAFVRGMPAANFKFEGNPCSVSFRDMSFTVKAGEAVSVYAVHRKSVASEKLFWMADDQVLRPFIPEAEVLVLSNKDADVVFQMDNDLLNVQFSKGIIVDVNTGAQRLLQLVDE